MKKLFLLIAVISISTGAWAQRGKVTAALSFIEQGELDKAKEALDAALEHKKTKEWPNTYLALGQFCQAVFSSENQDFKKFCDDPLVEAYEAYEKAIELDPKGRMKNRILTGMIYNSLALDMYNRGSELFAENDFAGALESFATQIEITESDKYVSALDTGMYYNAGLAAMNAGKHEEAIKYFETCAEMQYQGVTPYIQISENYLMLGDTNKAEQILTDLPSKFPDDKTINLQMINFYLKSAKYENAEKYINLAKENDPDNQNLYYAAGIMFLNQERYDEAIEELAKSVELDGNVYDTQYGLGAAYINKAAKMFEQANEIMDVNKYAAAVEEANEVYAKALPIMERALELKPDDVFTLRSLQELYYRFRQKDPELNKKYEEVRTRLNELEQ